jgi:hypothetical protein
MYVNVCVSICMLPLIPAGDYGTIPQIMHGRKDACYERGVCDWRGEPGSGSPLYYINTWAMVWPMDYPAVALSKIKQNFKTNGPFSFAL